jgi:hypothetical protein
MSVERDAVKQAEPLELCGRQVFQLPDERNSRHIELGERWVVHKFGNPTPEEGMHTRPCRKQL